MTTTYQDCVGHCVDYVGGTPSDAVQRDCKRAILEAYRDIANAFRWSYLLRQGRILTLPPFDFGTIQYQHASGTSPRLVTWTPGPPSMDVMPPPMDTQTGPSNPLPGSPWWVGNYAGPALIDDLADNNAPMADADPVAWPSWIVGAYLRIGFVAGKVTRQLSATTVQLDDQINFGFDYPAGTAFYAYNDSYLLPFDFMATDQALYERNFGGMEYVHPRCWLAEERFIFAQGVPQYYTITGDPLYPNRQLMRLAPLPSEEKTIDFLYQRRPRALTLYQSNVGSVTTDGTTNAVTGVGTAFAPAMVGSIIRFSDGPAPPSSIIGNAPAVFETRIDTWVSSTSVTTVDVVPLALTGVAYVVSDPVDFEVGAMLNAFFRCCEKHIAINRTLKDKPDAEKAYLSALSEARSADSRSFMGRSVGDSVAYRQRLRDMPLDLTRTY